MISRSRHETDMQGRSDDVRFQEKTGSERQAVKAAFLTQSVSAKPSLPG